MSKRKILCFNTRYTQNPGNNKTCASNSRCLLEKCLFLEPIIFIKNELVFDDWPESGYFFAGAYSDVLYS